VSPYSAVKTFMHLPATLWGRDSPGKVGQSEFTLRNRRNAVD
jgi:hypothetical protein